ncbi:MAG: riboflavin synthase [Clostridium sp.]|nr:riboflavin synthase [Clostridium sp.]MCM1208131.1 riboflavin synthase [Ruminococcus sp.]
MFTGLIEEMGTIKSIRKGAKSAEISILGDLVTKDTHIGDSIAVNGICMTVTSISGNVFTADVMAETMRRTSLSTLKEGSRVNLERAMAADGRFGGHIVAGHVDGTGQITRLEKEDNAVWITIKADRGILKYIVEKGSITIDGVSLTVAYVDNACFQVSIIPHTAKNTILLEKKQGDIVNLENDIIGKYVEKLMGQNHKESNINEDFLIRHGYF